MHHERPLIYLDNAATSWPKPAGVYDFMSEFYRSTGVSPGRSGFELAIEAGSLLDRLRLRLTRFFGGDEDTPERLCFGYNATDALNLLIPGLVAAGDHIVTTELEHNSVIRPVNHLVRDGGATATFVPFDGAGFVDPQDVARAIQPNTRLVVVNHGSNVIGTVQPLAAIGRVCRERGVPLVRGCLADRRRRADRHARHEHRRAGLHRPQGADGRHRDRRAVRAQAPAGARRCGPAAPACTPRTRIT